MIYMVRIYLSTTQKWELERGGKSCPRERPARESCSRAFRPRLVDFLNFSPETQSNAVFVLPVHSLFTVNTTSSHLLSLSGKRQFDFTNHDCPKHSQQYGKSQGCCHNEPETRLLEPIRARHLAIAKDLWCCLAVSTTTPRLLSRGVFSWRSRQEWPHIHWISSPKASPNCPIAKSKKTKSNQKMTFQPLLSL